MHRHASANHGDDRLRQATPGRARGGGGQRARCWRECCMSPRTRRGSSDAGCFPSTSRFPRVGWTTTGDESRRSSIARGKPRMPASLPSSRSGRRTQPSSPVNFHESRSHQVPGILLLLDSAVFASEFVRLASQTARTQSGHAHSSFHTRSVRGTIPLPRRRGATRVGAGQGSAAHRVCARLRPFREALAGAERRRARTKV